MTSTTGRSSDISRRSLLGSAASIGALTFVPARVLGANQAIPPSDSVRVASIGAGGQAGADIRQCSAQGGTIVALCDVDDRRCAEAQKAFPKANSYRDFRIMLDKEERNIDAVIIGTPDHTHAVATMAAIKRGKHVYCEKPLAHSLHEIRALTEAARSHQVVSQLGNQGHSFDSIRSFCEWIWDGAIGNVAEVRAIATDRYSRIRDLYRLGETHYQVPAQLDWDLWLGPAPLRHYHPMYVPGRWRGWSQFGTGVLGDWLCHIVDPVFWALRLKHPLSVEAVDVGRYDPVAHKETFPPSCVIRFDFAARQQMPPLQLYWHEGGSMPDRPPELAAGEGLPRRGALVIGERGKIVYGSHGAQNVKLIPDAAMRQYRPPAQTIPRSPGHMAEWLEACKKGDAAGASFDYGGPLSELTALGNIAIRFPGRKLQWDPQNMKFPDCPEADQYIDPPYREGWSL